MPIQDVSALLLSVASELIVPLAILVLITIVRWAAWHRNHTHRGLALDGGADRSAQPDTGDRSGARVVKYVPRDASDRGLRLRRPTVEQR
jgi:hypothetical protein